MRNGKAFGIVPGGAVRAVGESKRAPSRTVFVFQKIGALFIAVLVLEPFVYAVLSALETTSLPQGAVDVFLGNGKGGGFFIPRLRGLFGLSLFRREKTQL